MPRVQHCAQAMGPKEPALPFGFFGTVALLIALSAAVSLAYTFIWPADVPRASMFLTIVILAGIASSVGAFLWHASLLQGVGISGRGSLGPAGSPTVVALLRERFLIAACIVLALQAVICLIVHWVFRV